MRPWLAIDTATEQAGVAVATNAVLSEICWRSGRNHTTELTSAVAEAMSRARARPADLEGVAVAIGPGTYTGLRIGLAFAKGLAVVNGTRVVGVPTLHGLASALSPAQCARELPLHAALRAGRGRSAIATYPPDRSLWPRPEAIRAWTLEEWLAEHGPPGLVAGEFLDEEKEALVAAGFVVPPTAALLRRPAYLIDVARAMPAGELEALENLVPIYLGRGPA